MSLPTAWAWRCKKGCKAGHSRPIGAVVVGSAKQRPAPYCAGCRGRWARVQLVEVRKQKPTKTWKKREAQIAALFGTTRTPLSGSNSGHSSSDSLHPRLYVEAKHSKRHAVLSVYDDAARKAAAEGKLPLVALTELRRRGAFLVLPADPDVLRRVLEEMGP